MADDWDGAAGGGGGGALRRRLGGLLLFQIVDALVLLRLLLVSRFLAPGHMFPGHVRTTANYRRTQQRAPPTEHHCLLASPGSS